MSGDDTPHRFVGRYDLGVASSRSFPPEVVYGIDIGATNIKYCHVGADGTLLEPLRRRVTMYPCTPERLVTTLLGRIRRCGTTRVGVGFPGEFADGHVVRPGNLSRPGGPGTPVDPDLDRRWRGFDLQGTLRAQTERDVRVVNDATMAAIGASVGHGVELVFTLGTGFGLAKLDGGQPVRVRDVGQEVFVDGRTYDQALGEQSRAQDEETWRQLIGRALAGFIAEFGADLVHLAGGNARRVTSEMFAALPCPVIVNGNESSMTGAARLFYPLAPPHS